MNVIDRPAKDDRREAILAIARDVFMQEGYAAASMSAIAARVGGSKGTLYNYFRSKAELFAAVIQDQCAIEQRTLFDLGANENDVAKALTVIGRHFVRLILSDDVIAIHRIVVAESARFPEIGEAHFKVGPKRGKEYLMDLFKRAIAEGQLKPMDDPELAAEHAVELVLAGLYRRRLWNIGPRPTEAEIDAKVAAGVAVFMAAYGAK